MTQLFRRIQRHVKQYAGASVNGTAIHSGNAQVFLKIIADQTGFQVQAVRTRLGCLEGNTVYKEVLLNRTPVVRVHQFQYVGSAVFIMYPHHPVGYVALHVVRAARHKQIGMGSFSAQRHRDAIGIVVPQGSVGNVASLCRRTESHSQPAAVRPPSPCSRQQCAP